METNTEKSKKEVLGKTIGGTAAAAGFVATTSIAIDVLGDDGVDDLVAINTPEDMAGPTSAVEQQMAYEASVDVGDLSEADNEIPMEDVSAVRVHAAEGASGSYLASADLDIDTGGVDDLLLSSNEMDSGDMGVLGEMIDAVNDLA